MSNVNKGKRQTLGHGWNFRLNKTHDKIKNLADYSKPNSTSTPKKSGHRFLLAMVAWILVWSIPGIMILFLVNVLTHRLVMEHITWQAMGMCSPTIRVGRVLEVGQSNGIWVKKKESENGRKWRKMAETMEGWADPGGQWWPRRTTMEEEPK